MKQEKIRKRNLVKEYLEPILIAVLIALFIRAFVVQAFKIPSSSMEETLLIGDYLLVNKFIYGPRIPYSDKLFGSSKKFFQWKSARRGDVIVFIFPQDRSKDFIKRVIATGGEKVEILDKKIYIDNQLIEDPWGQFKDYIRRPEKFGPVVVPQGHLFVMGDNRDNSQDSRFWGFVDINDVKGEAFIIYFSWNSQTRDLFDKIRWVRLGKLIH